MSYLINCTFQNHKGKLNINNNNVIFYKILFKNILEAIKLLKYVKCEEFSEYRPWYYKQNVGLENINNDNIYLQNNIAFIDSHHAEQFIDNNK